MEKTPQNNPNIEIQPLGSYVELDVDGYVINPTSLEKIQEEWKPVIADAVAAFKEQFGDKLKNVYIRGSVAKGKAIKNISDLDSFAYVNLPSADIDFTWEKEAEDNIKNKYPFVEGVELMSRPMGIGPMNRILLNQAVCVYGEPIEVPKLKPGKEMRDEEVNENLFKEEIVQKQAEDYQAKKKRLREMLAEKMITDEEYKSDLTDLEAQYKPTDKPKSIDWTIRANEIVNLAEEFIFVMREGQISGKRSLLTKLRSNLVWNDEIISIINDKSIQALIDGFVQMKIESPKFEPNKSPLFTASNEKTDEFSSVFSTMLAWRDSFRTFDWAGLYSDLGFHLENTNKLLALAR